MTEPMDYATPAGQPAEKRVNGLGIASVVLGVLAFLGAWVPFCGLIPTLAFGVIGGILGVVGFVAANSDKRTGVGFPIVGIILNLLAIVLAVVVTYAFGAAVSDAVQQEQQRQQLRQQQKQQQEVTAPEPATP